jgi:putative molybdopterin biosynthesis protein
MLREGLAAVPELTHLRSFEHLKLMADPRRLAILQHLMVQPATLTHLGQALGEHPAWIRHHLRRLEQAGLVEMVETRRVHGAEERYYRACAGGYLLQDLILPQIPGRPVIVFCGSHDLVVERLAADLAPHLNILTLAVGSLNGLANLRLGLGHLAGCHLLDPQGEYNLSFVRNLFPDRSVHVVTLAHRVQGLMFRPGNPKGLQGLADLARPEVTFVNRNPGSGTRLWLDRQLEILGVPAAAIHGYDRCVNTHTACARLVASGDADMAVGLQAAAIRQALGFLPLFHERYDLVVPDDQLRVVQPLMDTLVTGAFRRWNTSLAGYEMTHAGEEIAQ